MVESQQEKDLGPKINVADFPRLLEGQLNKVYLFIAGDQNYKNHFAIYV